MVELVPTGKEWTNEGTVNDTGLLTSVHTLLLEDW